MSENNKTVREDNCQIFNTYFTNVTKGLKLRQVDESQFFEKEGSCRLIRENYGGESFSFKSISKDDIIKAVKKFPSNKALISNDIDIPILIIKNFATCYCKNLASIFTGCLKENKIPNLMKIAEISPVFKNLDNLSKETTSLKVLYQTLLNFLKASFLRN